MAFAILLAGCPAINTPVDKTDPNSDSLLFKLVNQWGIGGWEENVPDGALWITAEALKKQKATVYFFEALTDYSPTALATFSLRHADRTDLDITAYLGDPRYSPSKPSKLFLPTSANSTQAPLDGEILAMDLSEWREGLESSDLYLRVTDRTENPVSGEILSLYVEIFDDYNLPASQILAASTQLPLSTINGSSVLVKVNTAGNLSPVGTASKGVASKRFEGFSMLDAASLHARPLYEDEFIALQEKRGIQEEGRSYKKLVKGFGTGLIPPDMEQWESIRENGMTIELKEGSKVIVLPESVDLSFDKAFPPIGNQGSMGSCAAFSTAYYMLGYMMAKQNGWDLSVVSWDQGEPGMPSGMLDSIMSPKFVFNLINKGDGGGATLEDAVRLITDLGCASWAQVPYDETDYSSWPTESAWREAPKYRGKKPDYSDYGTMYYMTISTDDHIEILRRVLAAGIPLTIGIDAEQYEKLDAQDIWDATSYVVGAINHANTIVGYKNP